MEVDPPLVKEFIDSQGEWPAGPYVQTARSDRGEGRWPLHREQGAAPTACSTSSPGRTTYLVARTTRCPGGVAQRSQQEVTEKCANHR